MTTRFPANTLREISANTTPSGSFALNDPKTTDLGSQSSKDFSYNQQSSNPSASRGSVVESAATRGTHMSPHADRINRNVPVHCTDMVGEISDMFFEAEKKNRRDPNFLQRQSQVTEKMRAIVVDWLVDVMLHKFRLHTETFYLGVEIMDSYLSVAPTTRAELQLVGITSLLIAAKYEEMWAPEIRECVKITANTYTHSEVVKMERAIAGALRYRFTVPTPHPFMVRLLQVTKADTDMTNACFFFLEHGVMDYNMIRVAPSLLACAALYLANVIMNKPSAWAYEHQYYGRHTVDEVKPVAQELLNYCNLVKTAKYQAIRRKYATPKFSEITQIPLPELI